jgi:3D (Asp-Asp-Asp) domain-containing protein
MAKHRSHLPRDKRVRSLLRGFWCFVIVGLMVDSRSARSASVSAGDLPSAFFATVIKAPGPIETPSADRSVELLHDVTATPAMPAAALSDVPGSNPHARTIWMEVTAYCGCRKCCGPRACGLTASGRSIAYNGGLFVAADTNLLPFETQLKIPGYAGNQAVEVIDRGRAIKGQHIDVFFPTHEQALAWGRRWLPVTIVE